MTETADRQAEMGMSNQAARAPIDWDGFFAARPSRVRPAAAPRKTVFVAITPRTGSTFLCNLMQQSTVLGQPEEFLNRRGPMAQAVRRLECQSALDYLALIAHRRRSANGVFAIKTTFEHLEPFLGAQREAGLKFGELLPNVSFIYLDRRSVLAQAVSLTRAEMSGLWHKRVTGAVRTDAQRPTLEFDAQAIDKRITNILRGRMLWERFFATYGIEPLRLSYEDVVAEPMLSLAAVARFVGEPLDTSRVDLGQAPEKLSDELSRDWERRYVERHRL